MRVYLNRDGEWKIDAPDTTLESRSRVITNALYDLDGDGRPELVRLEFNFSVLELVELLLSRAVNRLESRFVRSSRLGR